jgi:hypothetical protein
MFVQTTTTPVIRTCGRFSPPSLTNIPWARARKCQLTSSIYAGCWSQQFERPAIRERTTNLYSRPQDNLVSGISEISFAFSLGVLWSEYCIILTGCGPANFSDTLERICYQGVIASAGVALFLRIVTGGGVSLEETTENFYGPLEDSTLIQVRIAEWSSALAVVGAIGALGYQTYVRGETNMEGLTGIDVSMCRAILAL